MLLAPRSGSKLHKALLTTIIGYNSLHHLVKVID